MFGKTRIERIFKFLVEDEQHLHQLDVEVMELKAKVEELEEACAECAEAVRILTGEVKVQTAILDDCETRINQLEIARAEMKKGLRELEGRKCHCEAKE